MKFVPDSVTRSIGMTLLQTKKNSPHIFFVSGVIGMVGTTVLACRATLRLHDKDLDEIRTDIHNVKDVAEHSTEHDMEYGEKEYYKDLTHVYIRSAVKVGKLYGPSIILGVASIGALTGSHVQLTRRNAALTATLAAVTKAYDEYRLRIQEEIGKEREQEIYYDMKDKEVVGEDGKKKTLKVVDTNGYSMWAKIFDESNPNYHPNPEFNRIFIQGQQNYFNHKLRTYGFVLLNDVYDSLGFERTSGGCVVGWMYGGDGDDFVDFGLFDGVAAARFLDGQEASVVLDFNVDGVIYEMIGGV